MKPSLSQQPAGVALVVTLMMMSVLVMMVVGLAGVMRNEQAAARNLTYQIIAEQMADLGAREAMALVLSNSTSSIGFPTATGPGWMVTNGVWVPLFSSNSAAQLKNLEEIGTNSLILSLPDGERGRVMAAWTNVVTPGGNASAPVGRYAWWVGDEGSKANLNAVAAANANLFPLSTNYPLMAQQIFKNAALGSENSLWVTGTNISGRRNFFFMPDSLVDTNVVVTDPNANTRRMIYRRNKGHITVWSSNVELNPWGQRKFPLSDLTNPANLTTPAAFNSLMAATFANPNLISVFGRDYVDKYGGGNRDLGSNVIRQILANASTASSNALVAPGNSPPPAGSQSTTPAPSYLALTPDTVSLNEVAVGFSKNLNPGSRSLQIQVWVVAELVTSGRTNSVPFENTQTTFTMPNNGIRFVSGNVTGGSVPAFGNFYSQTLLRNTPARRVGTIGSNNFYTNRSWACYEYTWSPSAGTGPAILKDNAGTASQLVFEVTIPRVEVYQTFGASGTFLVDWLTNQVTFRFSDANSTIVANSSIPQPSFSASMQSSVNLPASLAYQGVSKSDPRCRSLSSWETGGFAWIDVLWRSTQPSSVGSENGGLTNLSLYAGSSRLLLDNFGAASPSAFDQGKIWVLGTNVLGTATNVTAGWGTGRNLPSAGILGNLHTGLPWRTLRTSAQGNDPNPPDWFLYELFTGMTNSAAAAPRINLNSQAVFLGGSAQPPSMVPALLANLTNPAIDPSLLSASARWTSNQVVAASRNLTNPPFEWASGSPWPAVRTNQLRLTNQAADCLLFPSEVAELDGVGNVNSTCADREAAMLASVDFLTTRSDTFSVWSAGQGLVVNTNRGNRTNVMAEVRKQTVFQRIPQLDANGNVTGYRLKLLYTRNHIVE